MSRRVPGLVLLLALALAAHAEAASWVRVETPSFVVYGDVGERLLQDLASQFERFREALARLFPASLARTPVPTVVVAFGTERAYDPYRPLFNGRRVEISGYFHAQEDLNVVTLRVDDRELALRTVFHEYAHILLTNVAGELPAWVNEGLAEYYSTFSLSSDGREAAIGAPVPPHVQLLRANELLPLEQLLRVTVDSPLYNEGDHRTIFYAESWALVHMLLDGPKNRSAELLRYLRTAAAGVPSERAWREAFGSFDVIAELNRYLNPRAVRPIQRHFVKFEEGIARLNAMATPVAGAEVEAVLCDIIWKTDGLEPAAARLEKATTVAPASARARALLGLMRIEQQRDAEAQAILVEAAAETSDWFVQYRVASGLRRLIAVREGSSAPELVAAARRALGIAAAARPDLTHTLALTAEIAAATRTDLETGLAAIVRARTLAPERYTYAFTEAQLRMELGQFAAARRLLEPMTSAAIPTDIRDHALAAVLRNLERQEQYATSRQARLSAEVGSANQPIIPEYRSVKPGEQRTEGFLERIECGRNQVVLHVRAGDRALKFEARTLEAVEFLTFRANQAGLIVCGPRTPPDAVYLTWRPFPAPAALRTSDGEAVAVEFIPK